eukprot:2559018-Pleurochrysis_carterae.AAC.1
MSLFVMRARNADAKRGREMHGLVIAVPDERVTRKTNPSDADSASRASRQDQQMERMGEALESTDEAMRLESGEPKRRSMEFTQTQKQSLGHGASS